MSYFQQLQQLEVQRSSFLKAGHVTQGLLRRFKSRCGLLNDHPQSGSTRTLERKAHVKENLEKIAAISSALLFLCTSLDENFIASNGSAQFALELKDWWRSVPYPRNLEVLVRELCLDVKIDYKETGQIQFTSLIIQYILTQLSSHRRDRRRYSAREHNRRACEHYTHLPRSGPSDKGSLRA